MARWITYVIVILLTLGGLGAMVELPAHAFLGQYPATTIPADPGLTDTTPYFHGVEEIVDSPSVWTENEYGTYALWVNSCWVVDLVGAGGGLWETGNNPRTGNPDVNIIAAAVGSEVLVYDWLEADYLSFLYDATTQNAIYDAFDGGVPAANHRFHGEVGYELQVTDPSTPISTAAPELIFLKHDGTDGTIGTKVAGDLIFDPFTNITYLAGSHQMVDGNEAAGFIIADAPGTGVMVWTDPSTQHTHPLNYITNPTANTQWNMTTRQLRLLYTNPAVADGALEIEASGAFTGDLIHVHQHTGNPAAVDLVHIEADDVDVKPLLVDAANNGVVAIDTTGPIQMDDGNQAVGYIVMDSGAGTGIMQWTDPATIPGVWLNLAETAVAVNGSDPTVIAGPAVGSTANEVIVRVTCRTVNGGIQWEALSHPTPVADFVTYIWQENASNNLEVHVYNDSHPNLLVTVWYCDLG